MDGWAPVEPEWAVPPRAAIADLLWLSYGAWTESGSSWAAGVTATVAWVRGARASPVTSRVSGSVSRSAAEAEFWAAVAAEHAGPSYLAERGGGGVGNGWAPGADGEWARGVVETLRWLLGIPVTGGLAPPPMPVPARRADGSIPTARELYDSALAARPGWDPLPPQRRDLWVRCEGDVVRAHRLDERVRRIRRELATDAGRGGPPRAGAGAVVRGRG